MTATLAGDTVTDAERNGVDTSVLFATLNAVKQLPELARFQFRAKNVWIGGAHNRSTIKDFYGAGREDTSRDGAFTLDAGEPAALFGLSDMWYLVSWQQCTCTPGEVQ
jgi:hypothetical protein